MRTTQHVPDELTKGQLLNRFCGHQCNLTTLLDLCTDDKTAQREGCQTENKGHGSTFVKHVFNTGRDKGQAKNHDQNTTLAGELTNSTEKEQTSVCEATLTDVLNT